MRKMEEEIRLMKERERTNNNPNFQTQTREKPGWVVDGRTEGKNVKKTYSCMKCHTQRVRSDKIALHRCFTIHGG